jgi:hypothetical protein
VFTYFVGDRLFRARALSRKKATILFHAEAKAKKSKEVQCTCICLEHSNSFLSCISPPLPDS